MKIWFQFKLVDKKLYTCSGYLVEDIVYMFKNPYGDY